MPRVTEIRRTRASASSQRVQVGVASCPIHSSPFFVPGVENEPEIATALAKLDKYGNTVFQQLFALNLSTSLHLSATFFNETIYSQGFGVARYDAVPQKPPDDDTIFRIGSVSKLFPAMLTLQAADRGLIDLDAAVSDTIRDFSMVPPYPLTGVKGGRKAAGDVTWRGLLSQMSGVGRESPCLPCNVTSTEILRRLAGQARVQMPNTSPHYSNLAFDLLGNLVAERVLNNATTFEKAVHREILDVLGMQRTGTNITQLKFGGYGDNLAIAYVPGTHVVNGASLYDLGWSTTAGGMFSTARDLRALIREYINGYQLQGALLGDKSLYRAMLNPAWVDFDLQSGFAMPFELLITQSYQIARKGGNIPGYASLVAFAPELGFGMTLLIAGSFAELDAPGNDLVDILVTGFSALFARLQPPMPPQPPKGLADYVGLYAGYQSGVPVGQNINVTVNATSGTLSLTSIGGLLGGVAVHGVWYYGDTFGFRSNLASLASCIDVDALAFENVLIEFARDTSGAVVSFALPTVAYAIVFLK